MLTITTQSNNTTKYATFKVDTKDTNIKNTKHFSAIEQSIIYGLVYGSMELKEDFLIELEDLGGNMDRMASLLNPMNFSRTASLELR